MILVSGKLSAHGGGLATTRRPYKREPMTVAGKPPLLVWPILYGSAEAKLVSGRRIRARFFGLRDGWIAVLPEDRMFGPFEGLRSAALAALLHIDQTQGVDSRIGALLACRHSDFAPEHGRRR